MAIGKLLASPFKKEQRNTVDTYSGSKDGQLPETEKVVTCLTHMSHLHTGIEELKQLASCTVKLCVKCADCIDNLL